MEKRREKDLMWLQDQDLEMAGVDPTTISDELFDNIADYMAEYMDPSFSDALHAALEFNNVEKRLK